MSVGSEEFVGERQRLARELRDAGRPADAAVVAKLRKPPPVVLAVNRAARARPKAARAAAEAATRVKKAQVGADPEAFRGALKELDESLDLLAEVALAHLAPTGKQPSAAMRHRLRELLRNAVANDDARDALTRGVLRDETETAGFELFAGMAPAKRSRPSGDTARARSRASGKKRRQREQALRKELARAEERLEEARRSVERAERERINAERAVASARASSTGSTDGVETAVQMPGAFAVRRWSCQEAAAGRVPPVRPPCAATRQRGSGTQ